MSNTDRSGDRHADEAKHAYVNILETLEFAIEARTETDPYLHYIIAHDGELWRAGQQQQPEKIGPVGLEATMDTADKLYVVDRREIPEFEVLDGYEF